MYVGAHLLAGFRGPKDPYDGDIWCGLLLRLIIAFANGQGGVESSESSLVVVHAVKSEAEDVHGLKAASGPME